MERFVGRDGMLKSRDGVAVARRSAGANQDIGGPDTFAVCHLHGVRINERGAALENLDARLLQKRAVNLFEAPDFLVLVGDQGFPVERDMRNGPAESGGILEFAMKPRSVDQKLLRHTATDHTGAAKPIFFGESDASAMLGRDARSTDAAGASAYDEKITIVIRHVR